MTSSTQERNVYHTIYTRARPIHPINLVKISRSILSLSLSLSSSFFSFFLSLSISLVYKKMYLKICSVFNIAQQPSTADATFCRYICRVRSTNRIECSSISIKSHVSRGLLFCRMIESAFRERRSIFLFPGRYTLAH